MTDTVSLPLSAMLDLFVSPEGTQKEPDLDIVCPTFRVPRAVWLEISELARARGISASLLVNLLLDAHLRGEGRKGYGDLAPGYAAYVMRARLK